MFFKDESDFEEALVKYLHDYCGWSGQIFKRPTEEDLIENWAEIIYQHNKERDCLNHCKLTRSEMDQILKQFINQSPFDINKIINGTGHTVSIIRDNEEDVEHFNKPVSVKLFDSNEIAGGSSVYQIAEQPIFKTNNPIYPQKRGDFMLLINGMPLLHVELKRESVGIEEAISQIRKYSHFNCFNGIFSLVQIFAVMRPNEAKYFVNPGKESEFNDDFIFKWEDFNNNYVDDWKEFAKKLLSIPMAHMLIGYYTIPDESDGVLKVMRSYQIHAVQRIQEIAKYRWVNANSDSKYGGFVWHTTGSGKTMTSFKAAQLIDKAKYAEKVIFLIDRIELGEQSVDNFRDFNHGIYDIRDTSNTRALVSLLMNNGSDSSFIVTSIQKMSRLSTNSGLVKSYELEKIKKKRIVFIVDECHRDQAGEMHQTIKKTFKNALYFGFTGTPDFEDTKKIFGNELHRYTIVHGIRDKNVLGFDPSSIDVLDESDARKQVAFDVLKIHNEQEIKDSETAKKFLYYMNECPMIEIEKNLPTNEYDGVIFQYDNNRKIGVSYDDSLKKIVVKNILDKWVYRSAFGKFHAILATNSILEAVRYYKVFKEMMAEHNTKLNVTAVFDPSDDNSGVSLDKIDGVTEIITDYNLKFQMSYTAAADSYVRFKKDVCLRLAHKKPYLNISDKDKIDVVIVVNQLLTGFDSKFINTLYLDKKIQGKTLIQAVSRTNRIYKEGGKPHGQIVFCRFPHLMNQLLNDAVEDYSGKNPYGIFVNKLGVNIENMNIKYREIRDLYEINQINNFETNPTSKDTKLALIKLYSSFFEYMESAKLQEFNWEENVFRLPDENGEIKEYRTEFDEETYKIMLMRYKELLASSFKQGEPIPFNIKTNIHEERFSVVDTSTLIAKFKLFEKDLTSGNKALKTIAEEELHKNFNLLSLEDQKFADSFLNDLESGAAKLVEGKTFIDYIADYRNKFFSGNIETISNGFGLNENILREIIMLQPTMRTINKHGRLDRLYRDLDIDKAKVFLNDVMKMDIKEKYDINRISKNIIRNFILSNGLEMPSGFPNHNKK